MEDIPSVSESEDDDSEDNDFNVTGVGPASGVAFKISSLDSDMEKRQCVKAVAVDELIVKIK